MKSRFNDYETLTPFQQSICDEIQQRHDAETPKERDAHMDALLNRLPDGGKAVRSSSEGRTYPRRWSEADDALTPEAKKRVLELQAETAEVNAIEDVQIAAAVEEQKKEPTP